MVSVLDSRAVDRVFKARSVHTKNYKTGMFCFSAKHAALLSKSKNLLARKQDYVSEWSNTTTPGYCSVS
jgi:hypothetical protein